MWWILAGLMLLILMSLLRAVIGPTVIDRFVAINAITSKVSVIILLLAFARGEFDYIDITESMQNLKIFLTIRDKSPYFNTIKAKGNVGIPTIVVGEGEEFIDGSLNINLDNLK